MELEGAVTGDADHNISSIDYSWPLQIQIGREARRIFIRELSKLKMLGWRRNPTATSSSLNFLIECF